MIIIPFSIDSAEWWLVYGNCAPELQRIALKVLSQTTSASNCERNWSTFSYIHTKTRNRLKYHKLQKLVFTHYNMKFKMRHNMRSQEDIESSFNPINLDYIFQEEDHLAPWLEEREGPLLDGIQNSQWLPIDSDDDNDNDQVEARDNQGPSQAPSQGDDGGLIPPSENKSNSSGPSGSGSGGGGGNSMETQRRQEESSHSFLEEPYVRRDQNLIPHMTQGRTRMDEDVSDSVIGGSSRRGRARHGKNKRNETDALGDSSSSSVAQSYNDFDISTSYDGSQGTYPPYYQGSSYMPYGYGHDPQMPNPPYYQTSMDYQGYYDPSTSFPYDQQQQQIEQPRSSGVFDYVFGGTRYNDSQGDDEGYDPAHHSTMW
jgi:hypothetical protein